MICRPGLVTFGLLLAWSAGCAPQAAPPAGNGAGASSNSTAAGTSSADPGVGRRGPAVLTAPVQPVSAEEVVNRLSEFYRGVRSFTVDAARMTRIEGEDGNPLPFFKQPAQSRSMSVQRPNRVSMQDVSGQLPQITCDGEKLIAYLAGTSKFLEFPAPPSIDDLVNGPLGMVFGGGMQPVLLHLAMQDPRAALLEGVTETAFVGQEDLNGTAAHRLALTHKQESPFGSQEMKWQIWVAAQGDPVVLQVRFDQGRHTVDLPGSGKQTIQVSIVESYDKWKFNPVLPNEAFAAVVPAAARKASDLQDLFTPVPPLLGEAAPPVKLELLGGGELDLAAHAGKDVVMLDFWATWCGPCRLEMPILAQLAEEYKDKGVVLYAVNQQEEPEVIQKFLEEQGWSLTVALDKGSAAGNAYKLDGIPHLVIIDRKGTVQAVHSGVPRDYETSLKPNLMRELDAVLAGHDIYNGLPEPEAVQTDDSGNPLQRVFRALDRGAKAAGGATNE